MGTLSIMLASGFLDPVLRESSGNVTSLADYLLSIGQSLAPQKQPMLIWSSPHFGSNRINHHRLRIASNTHRHRTILRLRRLTRSFVDGSSHLAGTWSTLYSCTYLPIATANQTSLGL